LRGRLRDEGDWDGPRPRVLRRVGGERGRDGGGREPVGGGLGRPGHRVLPGEPLPPRTLARGRPTAAGGGGFREDTWGNLVGLACGPVSGPPGPRDREGVRGHPCNAPKDGRRRAPEGDEVGSLRLRGELAAHDVVDKGEELLLLPLRDRS